MAKGKGNRGIFGSVRRSGERLPVAGRYLAPRKRRIEWILGLILVGVVIAVFAAALALRGPRVVAGGPLSSHHATFESDCSTCHRPLGGVPDHACLDCHQRLGEEEVLDLAGHVASHGAASALDPALLEDAPPCVACHVEHRGRWAEPTETADARCVVCHDVGSFERGHPEFRFAREGHTDDPGLRFAHRFHVDQLRKDKGIADPQQTCLYCHQAGPDGSSFRPLDFERQCGECHLSATTGTPRLAIGDPADPNRPGVSTLEEVRASGRPGTRWAWFQNPSELRTAGGRIQKRPVYHEDPWILDNLSRIRATLYPELGLAALLRTALPHADRADEDRADEDRADEGRGDENRADEGAWTAQMIETLREQARELRGSPQAAVQAELEAIEALLSRAAQRLRAGERVTLAQLGGSTSRAALSTEHAAALEQLALDLTEPCRRCHVLASGALLPVTRDQRELHQARFSHRAHVKLVPLCVDCHGQIASLNQGEPTEDDPTDRAETLNLPRVELCRECHNAELASQRCTTCHLFHPEPGRQSFDRRSFVPHAAAAGAAE